MSTLQELLAEWGMEPETTGAQTKTASAPKVSDEVQSVLENLGLAGTEEDVTKLANEQKGDERMGLEEIYAQMFGDQPAEENEQTKVAAEEGDGSTGDDTGAADDEVTETGVFGEMTSHYFNGVLAGMADEFEKLAGSVEEESDQDDEQPLAHMGNSGQLTGVIGKPADPHMPVNHSASSRAPLRTMTGNTSPYSLKAQAQVKAILKRVGKMEAGDVGAHKD